MAVVERSRSIEDKDLRVVLITCPTLEIAESLAFELVKNRHAACVNIVPGLTSIYSYKGQVEKDKELLLIVKTSLHLLGRLQELLRNKHPYEVPECVALSPTDIGKNYAEWWDRSLEK